MNAGITGPRPGRPGPHRASYRPAGQRFRLPASGYYALAAAVSAAVFFLLWWAMSEGDGEAPIIGAGLGASMVLAGAVFLREVVFALSRRRIRAAEEMLDRNLSAFPASLVRPGLPSKLSLERNIALIRHIKKKSEAAKVLSKYAEGHREVFDLCDEYLQMISEQMPTVAPGSPRIAAFRRGNEVVGSLHRYHLMQWAGIEARSLTQAANSRAKISDRLRTTQQAIDVVDFALRYYPSDPELVESLEVLADLADSLKVKDLVERAERAVKRGNLKRARSLYGDALYILDKTEVDTGEAAAAAERIRGEIAKLEPAASE